MGLRIALDKLEQAVVKEALRVMAEEYPDRAPSCAALLARMDWLGQEEVRRRMDSEWEARRGARRGDFVLGDLLKGL